jgi:hypothetical protein
LPPGAPLRSGRTVSMILSPGLSVLGVQPRRNNPAVLPPSRFQTFFSPVAASTTSSTMKTCGLTNCHSTTVPESSIGFSES